VIEQLMPDGLWERDASVLPRAKPRGHRYPGRRPIDDRGALAGSVAVLETDIARTATHRPRPLGGVPRGRPHRRSRSPVYAWPRRIGTRSSPQAPHRSHHCC